MTDVAHGRTMITTSTTHRTGTRADDATSARLDAEWRRLRRDEQTLAAVHRWKIRHDEHTPLRSLDQLLTECGRRRPDDAWRNALLGRLVERAHSDRLAARIVLQRLVPGLLSIAKVEQQRDHSNAFEQLLAEAYLSIRRYDVAARPDCIAARLLNDARHRAFTAPRRRAHFRREVLRPPGHLDVVVEDPPLGPFDELVGVLATARANGLDHADLTVLCGVVNHRDATHYAPHAPGGGVPPRTMRHRAHRAIERTRPLVDA